MKIIIGGLFGVLGNSIIGVIENTRDDSCICGVSKSARDGDIYKGIPAFNDFSKIDDKYASQAEAIIDFSHPDNLNSLLDFALRYKIPVVIGTTGFTEDQERKIEEASKLIPILVSHNTAIGANAMFNIVKYASDLLKDWDIELIESHNNRKPDAPSGTSQMIIDSIRSSRPDINIVNGRFGRDSKRKPNDITIHSVRAGTIISDHELIFAGNNEVIKISHSALSDNVFAAGAVEACHYLKDKECGIFEMTDVLNK